MALDLAEQILAAFEAAITAANITGIGARVERDREDALGRGRGSARSRPP
jgi:hypothetical protein